MKGAVSELIDQQLLALRLRNKLWDTLRLAAFRIGRICGTPEKTMISSERRASLRQ